MCVFCTYEHTNPRWDKTAQAATTSERNCTHLTTFDSGKMSCLTYTSHMHKGNPRRALNYSGNFNLFWLRSRLALHASSKGQRERMFPRTTKVTSDSRMDANWDTADHSLLLMSNLGRWNATNKSVSAFLDHRGYSLDIISTTYRHAVNARLDSIPCPWWAIHLPILCSALGNNAYPHGVRWRRATTTYLSDRRLCSCLEATGVRASLSGSKIVADDSLRSFSDQKLDGTSPWGAPTEIEQSHARITPIAKETFLSTTGLET